MKIFLITIFSSFFIYLLIICKGLPESHEEMFGLENRWLRCVNYQPEPMTLLITLIDDQDEVIKQNF